MTGIFFHVSIGLFAIISATVRLHASVTGLLLLPLACLLLASNPLATISRDEHKIDECGWQSARHNNGFLNNTELNGFDKWFPDVFAPYGCGQMYVESKEAVFSKQTAAQKKRHP